MYPIVAELGGYKIYSYGLLIAFGIIAGVGYMAIQGKKETGLTFDQANTLFLLIFVAAVAGGKIFLFFENPAMYIEEPSRLFRGNGFVFYGSFLFAVPTMLWFFRKNQLNTYVMLDVMAVTTCLVHMCGRLGCFLAGCCYGSPTTSWAGVVFTDPFCYAEPKGVPLHPTQLYEALFISFVLVFLLYKRSSRSFYGQLFLLYLTLYAIGRVAIEFFRGDEERGYIFNVISHSQMIAIIIIFCVFFLYRKWSVQNQILAKAKESY